MYWPYTRYTGMRGFFFKSGNVLAGVIFIFGPIFLFFLWFSLVPVPLLFSVESENTVQIVLNGFVLTLSAIYGYAVAKIQENGNFPDLYFLYLLSYFNFFVAIDRSHQVLSSNNQICLYCGHIWIFSVIRKLKKTTFYQDRRISGSVFFLFFVRFEFFWS